MTVPLRYSDMVDVVVDRIPAFRDSDWGREVLETDRDLPYVVFGAFASFLKHLLTEVPPTDPTVRSSFELLNEMAASPEQQVVDLAATGVFEVLTDSAHSIRAARQLLYGPAIHLFEQMIQLWGVDVTDP